jgi:hypothetical protein
MEHEDLCGQYDRPYTLAAFLPSNQSTSEYEYKQMLQRALAWITEQVREMEREHWLVAIVEVWK